MSLIDFLYLGRMEVFLYHRWGVDFFLGMIAAAYLIFRRKRGDSMRECALLALVTTVLLILPGISYVVKTFGDYPICRNIFECIPIVLLVAEAADEVIRRAKDESLVRRIILVVFLFMLIPAGLSVGDGITRDNIARHKSFTGVTPETAWMCEELHRICESDYVEAVLPQEFQQEVGIADTGVSCPQVNYRGSEDLVTPYLEAAREYDVHLLVLHDDLANANESVLHGNGFNVIQFLPGYQVWTDEELN